MPQEKRAPFFTWSVISLLAFVALMRGGQVGWVALAVSGGIVGLLVLRWLRALWTVSSPIIWSPWDLVLLLGLAWAWVASRLPAAPPDALVALLIILGCLGCFLLTRALAFDGSALPLALALCVLGGIIVLAGLFQMFGVLPHPWWDPPQFLAATFINHNHFAAYLELLAPIGFALWLAAPLRPAQRFLAAVSSSLMAIGLILSCSRGAWLSLVMAAVIGLACFGARRDRTVWNWRGLAIAVAVIAAIGFLVTQPPILARGMSLLEAPSDSSFQTRQAIWHGASNLVKEQPLTGRGLGSFVFELPRHRPAGLYRLLPYAFNDYLQLTAEAGLVGLAIAAWIAAVMLGRIVRLSRFSQTPWKRALGLGGLIGLGSVLLHSLVDYPWQIPAVAFTAAAVAGLLTGIRYYADPSPLRVVTRTAKGWRRHLVRWVATPLILAGLAVVFKPLTQLIVADAWASRGQAQHEAGRFEDAIGSYRQATGGAPSVSAYYRQLGESLVKQASQRKGYERRHLLKEAAKAFRQAVALVPHDARSADALAEALQALGEAEEADRALAQAISSDPHNPLYWKHWAELKLIRGDAPGASEAFRRAAELAMPFGFFPSLFAELDDAEAFVQRGESALQLGRVSLAQTAFTIALQLEPAHQDAQIGLALCAVYRGDPATAQHVMASVHDPLKRARWFIGLAQYHLRQGQLVEAHDAVETSLALDPTNVLARQLQLVVARMRQDDLLYGEAVDRLLSLNRPPVFVRVDSSNTPIVVWEPALGLYSHGHKTRSGWSLSSNGAIQQSLAIPPGKVRMTVIASGTKAAGLGPTMTVSWNGQPVFTTTVQSETWAAYDFETEVKPGESLLTVEFVNDFNNPVTREDRNLKLQKLVATWEPL